ncbi:MAG: rhomboid family intramembrane serine protease, partial [Ktedonobacterales bacterium]
FSLVPCEYTAHCAVYPGTPTPFWLTLFTSMFLHASWTHLLGNMAFLWVFGGHVERSMGHLRYLVFYFLCGLGADALEIATSATSNVSGLGASGAIAGVLGAYLLLYPTSTVRAVLPINWVLIPVWLPAWVLIVGWFLLQLVSGVASLSTDAGARRVAWPTGHTWAALSPVRCSSGSSASLIRWRRCARIRVEQAEGV